MKNIKKYLSVVAVLMLVITACDKVKDLPYYGNGTAPALSSSVTSVVLVPADSILDKATFNWTNPMFETDSATYKYVLEVDTSSAFVAPKNFTVSGLRNLSLKGRDFNNMLVNWGVPFGTAKELSIRLKASYANNNDMKLSNVVKVTVTPVALPFNFTSTTYGTFLPTIGNRNTEAASLSWGKPDYGTARIKYELQYDSATKNFANPKLIPIGDEVWTYSMTFLTANIMAQNSGVANGATGTVDARIKATVIGTGQVSYSTTRQFSIRPTSMVLYLWVAGDYQKFPPYAANLPAGNTWGWDPASAPKIASTDGVNYDGYIYVPAGGSGEFKLTSQADWNGTNYGSGGAGLISATGGNLNWPAGTYFRVQVNTQALTWSATPITTWGVIGDGTPGQWNTSTPLTFNTTTLLWTGSVTFNAGNFKFRANNGWDINLGGLQSAMNYGGDNIPVTLTGARTVTLDLRNAPNYTYTVL
ncbi:MAG TPA: SusE domain-containing protein [Chitinophagaceae bacterium]|jgi:hypothetical protein|nr:SusE domain-containing protein [Chitinophagaceae bacterium]HMU57048.1 SusE domain-containing protein [Chitinophagaceae bacterium]